MPQYANEVCMAQVCARLEESGICWQRCTGDIDSGHHLGPLEAAAGSMALQQSAGVPRPHIAIRPRQHQLQVASRDHQGQPDLRPAKCHMPTSMWRH